MGEEYTDTILHRWEYDPLLYVHRCVPATLGDVPSQNRCCGCGIMIADETLHEVWDGQQVGRSAWLNGLAYNGLVFHPNV